MKKRNENRQMLQIVIGILLTWTALNFMGCTPEPVEPIVNTEDFRPGEVDMKDFIFVENDEDFQSPIGMVCTGTDSVFITGPNHVFDTVTLGYIIKNQPYNHVVDTFFTLADGFEMSPYQALALQMGFDSSSVCDETMIHADSLMYVSGFFDMGDSTITAPGYWVCFNTISHCCYALVTFVLEID